MKIKDYFIMAFHNSGGRKKTGKGLAVLFFISLVVYFNVNSMADSIDRAVDLIWETPAAKNVICQDKDGTLGDKLKEKFGSHKYVSEIYPYIQEISADVEGIKDNHSCTLSVKSSSESYKKYLYKGTMPKEGEILLPQYFNSEGEKSYKNGSDYIGRTLTITIDNYLGEEVSHSYVVSGTYDNIYAVTGSGIAFLNEKDAVTLSEENMEGIEQKLEEIKKAENNPDIIYVGYEKKYYYAVVVDSVEHKDEVIRELRQKLDVYGSIEMYAQRNSIEEMFSFVCFVGNVITIILLAIVMIIMAVAIGNDIRGRKKELAIYMVQGYTRKQLIKTAGIEYAIRMLPALIFAGIFTVVILWVENGVLNRFFSIEYRIIHMKFSMGAFFAGTGLYFLILAAAFYCISCQMHKLNILKEIKSEG